MREREKLLEGCSGIDKKGWEWIQKLRKLLQIATWKVLLQSDSKTEYVSADSGRW